MRRDFIDWVIDLSPAAAVAAALGIALAPRAWAFARRPKLRVVVSDVEPHCRLTQDATTRLDLVYLRAAIHNRGRREARRVRATLVDLLFYDPVAGQHPWVRHDLDPSALHWVSMSHAEHRGTAPEVHLTRKLNDFVDLVAYARAPSKALLVMDDNRPRGFRLDPRESLTEFRLKLVVSASNAASEEAIVAFRISRENFFTDVRLVRRLPRKVRESGPLKLLGQARTG